MSCQDESELHLSLTLEIISEHLAASFRWSFFSEVITTAKLLQNGSRAIDNKGLLVLRSGITIWPWNMFTSIIDFLPVSKVSFK